MATASAESNSFSAPGALMKENFPDVLDARFAFVKNRVWKAPVTGLKYWNVEDTNRAYEKHSYVAGTGTVPQSRDVDDMPLASKMQGFDNTYTPETYRLGLRIERRLRETDQYRVIDKLMTDLNQSGKDTIELYAALPFNTAFDATVEWICADGMNLIDSDRPYEDPTQGTWDNEESSGTPTQARIATMRLNFYKTKNEIGRIRPIIMDKLIIPPDLQDTLITNLGSALKPDVSTNNKNYLTEYGLSYDVWPYLTSTTAWFGMGPKNDLHELFWYWGSRPRVIPYTDSNPDVFSKRLRMVFVSGADRPTNLRGNAGT